MSYNGSLGQRRYEGFDLEHAFISERLKCDESQAQRCRRMNVSPPKPARRSVEGAHLRPMNYPPKGLR